MSKLLSLTVKGIRLFNPDPKDESTQTIDLDDKMTLITGPNGSGKTTIFEAIQYALIGVSQENSGGIGLFYDRKVLGKEQYTAECRLKFRGVDNHIYQIVRKRNITDDLNREISQILDEQGKIIYSTKAEIDFQIPRLFGSSKSIIKNVIFCKQFEQTWPIEMAGSKLKERFDKIFGIEAYNKAHDEIYKALKSKISELKEENNVYPLIKKSFDKKKIIEQRITDEQYEISRIKEQMEQIAAEIAEKNEKQTRYNDLNNLISQKEGELKGIIEQIENYKKENCEVTKTLNELGNEEVQIIDELESIKIDINSKNIEINKFKNEIEQLDGEKKEIIKKLESQRSINNQINDNEQKISKNKKEIKSKINEIKELIHEEIDEENFSKIIKEKQKSLNNEENSIRVETDKEKTKYEKSQIELDSKEKSLENKNKTKNDIESDLIENLGSTDFENEYKKYKNEQENLQKLISLDTKSQSIYEEFVSESRSESCQCPLCKRKFKDNSERDEFIKNELEKVLKDLPSKIASNEEKLRKVSEKIESIENLRDKHFIYQQVLEDIPKLEEEIDTLKSKRDQNFEEYQQIKQNYDEIRSKKEKFEHEVIQLKNSIDLLNNDCSSYEENIKRLQSNLSDSIYIESLENSLNNIGVQQDKLKSNIENYQKEIDEKSKKQISLYNMKSKIDRVKVYLNNKEKLNQVTHEIDELHILISEVNDWKDLDKLKTEFGMLKGRKEEKEIALNRDTYELENEFKGIEDNIRENY
ncbi:hypothetical protein TVAG_332540 [Trichomonas vaginalis G3]|uniref:Zinc-hook domain-containing protein n=1 Tax=Trichomonas vaginalis (strain ATCC PRA-98 / G3) TaxID=412133 RepID=A2FAC7_TRIV3|nr:G-quadruplex DNA binding [Trichomonas vaginalis G3]EAX98144.1 hypothetical protein TVAG_332540 [Trichomonas vaginalis G3]KAI5484860.1 G-quadruplex DNA binding [Trichomonas vaginalis G3]|eukprot:XP_001311074.1 hypothetical protein [Trichomonas vaginalis G3]